MLMPIFLFMSSNELEIRINHNLFHILKSIFQVSMTIIYCKKVCSRNPFLVEFRPIKNESTKNKYAYSGFKNIRFLLQLIFIALVSPLKQCSFVELNESLIEKFLICMNYCENG